MAKNLKSKAELYMKEFPKYFIATPNNDLFCLCCNSVINHERRSTVMKHIKSDKYQKLILVNEKSRQTFIDRNVCKNQNWFNYKIANAFLSADIPLYKVNNPVLKSLFEYLGKPLPFESALWSIVSTVAQDELNKVKEKIFQKDIFLIIDESEISGKQIFYTLIGIITEPEKTYLLDCRICDGSVNQQYVIQLVDDLLRNFSINR